MDDLLKVLRGACSIWDLGSTWLAIAPFTFGQRIVVLESRWNSGGAQIGESRELLPRDQRYFIIENDTPTLVLTRGSVLTALISNQKHDSHGRKERSVMQVT